MKIKHLILLTFFITSIVVSAQESTNQFDDKGKKTGKWIKKYKTGKTEYEAEFKNGIPEGLFKRYNEKGKLVSSFVFSESGLISRGNLYHDNEKVMANGKYINKLKDSLWSFYSEEGMLIRKANYLKNEYNGLVINYYKNGQIKDSIYYSNGLLNGDFKEFYENGNLKVTRKYINDIPEGAFKLFHENKVFKVIGKYKGGKKDGNWKYYSPSLKIEKEETYEKGNLIYTSEEIVSFWSDSLKNVRSKEKYEKSGRSSFYAYHMNGQLAREGFYYKNKKDSVWQYFSEKGVLESIQTFYHGDKSGHWTFYYPDGKVFQEYAWYKNKMDGEYKEFYNNGKVKIQGFYKEGKQIGKWMEYKENGELLKAKDFNNP